MLLFAAFFTLFATMFPTLSEAVTGERLTVGAPFFNQWLTPVGLLLLFLTGVMLAWRKSTVSESRTAVPLARPVGGRGARCVLRAGYSVWGAGPLLYALRVCRRLDGAGVHSRRVGATTVTGTDLFTALVGSFARSKRRYGGYVVHLGIVLVFLGFAGGAFERDETVLLTPGQTFELSPDAVRYVALSVTQDATKQMATAMSKSAAMARSSRGLIRPAGSGPDGRASRPLRWRCAAGQPKICIRAAGYDAGEQSATLLVRVNPLVNWIWSRRGDYGCRRDHHCLPAGACVCLRGESGARERRHDLAGAAVAGPANRHGVRAARSINVGGAGHATVGPGEGFPRAIR